MADLGIPLRVKMELDNTSPQAAAQQQLATMKQIEQAAAQAARAEQAHIDSTGKMRDAATGRFVKGGQAAAQATNQQFGAMSGAAMGFGQAVLGAAGGLASIGTAIGLIRSGIGVLEEARSKFSEIAKGTIAARDALVAVKAIQGQKGGVSDEELLKNIEFRKYAGMDSGKAASYREQFFGSAESSKGKLSADEYKKLEFESGRFASYNTAAGESVDPYARLAGRILGFGNYKTANQVVAKEESVRQILNEGEGSTGSNVSQFLQSSGTFLDPTGEGKGLVKNEEQLAALIATASKTSPESASTLTDQLARAVRGFNKNMKTGDIQESGQADFLKSVGVSQSDYIPEALNKIFAPMQAAEQKGEKLDFFLSKVGYRNVEERNALIAQYRNRDFLNRQLQRGEESVDPEGLSQEMAGAFAKSPEFAMRAAEAGEEGAKIKQGMGGGEQMLILRKQARTRLRDRGEFDTAKGSILNTLTRLMTGGIGGEESRVDEEVQAMLGEQGKEASPFAEGESTAGDAANFLHKHIFGNLGAVGRAMSTAQLSLAGANVDQSMRASGGDGGEVGGKLDTQTGVLVEIRDALRNPGGTMPLAGRPVAKP